MEDHFYARLAQIEDEHWWFVAQRRILGQVMGVINLPAGAEILEIGSGSGGNLPLFARYGRVTAIEPNARARARAAARGIAEVRAGEAPVAIDLGGRRFDLIAMLDVLEHIDDDAGALAALHDLLRPRGRLLITVPAYQWLWSEHDVWGRGFIVEGNSRWRSNSLSVHLFPTHFE